LYDNTQKAADNGNRLFGSISWCFPASVSYQVVGEMGEGEWAGGGKEETEEKIPTSFLD
jgi:hypothetical protein